MAKAASARRIGHLDRFFRRPLMQEALARLIAGLGLGTGPRPVALGLVAATPGEGVTTVALYLGAAIARTFDRPALVVEANFRRPRLAAYAGVPGSPGLRDVLEGGGLEMEIRVRRSPLTNLHLLPAGGPHPQPLGLVATDRFARFLAAARQRYPVVLVDAPPVLACAEAGAVLKPLDLTALVVAGAAGEDTVRRAVRGLDESGVRLAGTILNHRR